MWNTQNTCLVLAKHIKLLHYNPLVLVIVSSYGSNFYKNVAIWWNTLLVLLTNNDIECGKVVSLQYMQFQNSYIIWFGYGCCCCCCCFCMWKFVWKFWFDGYKWSVYMNRIETKIDVPFFYSSLSVQQFIEAYSMSKKLKHLTWDKSFVSYNSKKWPIRHYRIAFSKNSKVEELIKGQMLQMKTNEPQNISIFII